MKYQRLLIVITVFNVILLLFSAAQTRAVMQGPTPVLRGRALEMVDDKGRVRASITLLPGDPHFKMAQGRSTSIKLTNRDRRERVIQP